MADEEERKKSVAINSIHALDDEKVLEALVSSGEGKNLEFKSRLPPPHVIIRDIVAFANTDGGIILYGIGGDGSIVGLSKQEIQNYDRAIIDSLARASPAPRSMSWKLLYYRERYLGAVVIWPDENKPFIIEDSVFTRLGTTNLRLKKDEFLTLSNKRDEFEPLEIRETEIKQFSSMADEDSFTEVLLIPFLRHIGFRSVLGKGHREKTLEFGQDIRSVKYQLPTGHWLYFALQIKTENLVYSATESKKNHNVEKVLTQARMAFEHKMFDAETNVKFLPDHVLIVATGNINEGARLYLTESLAREKRRKILFWEGAYLRERIIQQGLPRICQKEIREFITRKDDDG